MFLHLVLSISHGREQFHPTNRLYPGTTLRPWSAFLNIDKQFFIYSTKACE